MDMLLQAVAYYKRRAPKSTEEEECVENMFQCLCSALVRCLLTHSSQFYAPGRCSTRIFVLSAQLITENQTKMRHAEGFELMLRTIKEKSFARHSAIKVLDFAIANNAANCQRLIDCGGLRVVFPAFMGHVRLVLGGSRVLALTCWTWARCVIQGLSRTSKVHGAAEAASEEEHLVSIVTWLLAKLPSDSLHRCVGGECRRCWC